MVDKQDMSRDFADWYAASFMDEGERRDRRWQGVVDVCAKADDAIIEVLVRLAFQTVAPASGRKSEDLGPTYETVVSLITGGDSYFNPSQSKRELQILAAAALVELFSHLPNAALAVTTTSFGGLRALDLPMDLVRMAERALLSLSDEKHKRFGIEKFQLGMPEVQIATPVEGTALTVELLNQQLDMLRGATSTALKSLVTSQNKISETLYKRIRLGEEELQMLWWLIGGYSRQLHCSFELIDRAFRPLALGHELGEMTSVSPGPASICAMLDRAMINDDALLLEDAVNAADTNWMSARSISKRISPASTPIHFALEQRLELGVSTDWRPSWASLTGLPKETVLPAVKLAELFYREYLYLNGKA